MSAHILNIFQLCQIPALENILNVVNNQWHGTHDKCMCKEHSVHVLRCLFVVFNGFRSVLGLGEDAERRKATQIFAAYAVARLLHSVQGPEPEVLDPDSVAVLQWVRDGSNTTECVSAFLFMMIYAILLFYAILFECLVRCVVLKV